MTHTLSYDKLHATSLTSEQHERTCGYWFTVTSGATAHTAFATRAGLDRWLSERGLSLAGELPDAGTWGTTRVTGEYRTASHGAFSPAEDNPYRMVADDEWGALSPMAATADLSNGRYTLALITEQDGIRTVHTLNPNVKTRVEFDRRNTAAWLAG
jgi:hypothetical protein